MIKENKEYFLYVLGILVLFFVVIVVYKNIIGNNQCSMLDIWCMFGRTKVYEYDEYPKISIDTNKDYKATIKTNFGDFEIDLYEKNAPLAVNSFVFLAGEGYYNGVKFHRVIKGLLIQTGDRNTLNSDLTDDGSGGPGYFFKDEVNWDSLGFNFAKREELENLGFTNNTEVTSKYMRERSVALANSGPDTNGSQFFIITALDGDSRVRELEGKHTVFGGIISGWDIIEEIENTPVDDPSSSSPRPEEDIYITDVTITAE